MNPSRIFILRPVATSLLMVAVLLAGIVAFRVLPVAALPEIAEQFRALKNAQGGSSDAVVYSAFPIAASSLGGGGGGVSPGGGISPGGATATGSGSPIVLHGLTNGVTYTLTVTAFSSFGTGPPSAPSNPVTPARRPPPTPDPPTPAPRADVPAPPAPVPRPPKP